jgi:hypothetical protein
MRMPDQLLADGLAMAMQQDHLHDHEGDKASANTATATTPPPVDSPPFALVAEGRQIIANTIATTPGMHAIEQHRAEACTARGHHQRSSSRMSAMYAARSGIRIVGGNAGGCLGRCASALLYGSMTSPVCDVFPGADFSR